MICIPIVADTPEEAVLLMEQAYPCADLFEIRADFMQRPDVSVVLAARKKPVIVTIMPKHEGGRFNGTENQRIALLEQALNLGAEYIDVNRDCPALQALLSLKKKTSIIVSYHNYTETPRNLEELYTDIKATGADIVKIATMARTLQDNRVLFDTIQKHPGEIIGICMGEYGEISRILGPLYGSFLTFASLDTGRESAPGQIPAAVMRNHYRISGRKPGWKTYGIIGNPVSKSKGYIVHNALFNRYGINAVYVNFLVDDPGEFAAVFRDMVSGFSVTMPHKKTILQHLDCVDPAALQIGAVNTVVNENDRLVGYNTDMAGAVNPIQARMPVRDKRVTILGAGGAARAIAFGIAHSGGTLTILNRTAERAESLAADLNCRWGSLDDFPDVPTDVLVNVTSVGMAPDTDATPVDTRYVRNMLVFDAIYNPEKTALLREAEKNSCSIVSGREMFIHQAAEQFRLWTGISPDRETMKASLL